VRFKLMLLMPKCEPRTDPSKFEWRFKECSATVAV